MGGEKDAVPPRYFSVRNSGGKSWVVIIHFQLRGRGPKFVFSRIYHYQGLILTILVLLKGSRPIYRRGCHQRRHLLCFLESQRHRGKGYQDTNSIFPQREYKKLVNCQTTNTHLKILGWMILFIFKSNYSNKTI